MAENHNMCVFASCLDVVWVSSMQEIVCAVQLTGASLFINQWPQNFLNNI